MHQLVRNDVVNTTQGRPLKCGRPLAVALPHRWRIVRTINGGGFF